MKVNVPVEPGAMVTTPLCGMSHGTSDTSTPVNVAFPLFVKLTLPFPVNPGLLTSMRLATGFATTDPAGGAVEKTLMGTVS